MEKEIEQETEQGQPLSEGVEAVAGVAAPPERESRESRDSRSGQRRGGRRRRACIMCVDAMTFVDFKEFSFLRRFLSDRGRIDSRRKTGTCAKHQRALAQAIKRARHLALLPYTADHIRTGVTPPR